MWSIKSLIDVHTSASACCMLLVWYHLYMWEIYSTWYWCKNGHKKTYKLRFFNCLRKAYLQEMQIHQWPLLHCLKKQEERRGMGDTKVKTV